MGRTDIKKQNKNKITEEPLTWTEEEIIKKCENMGFLDMEDEDTDVKEKYRKLKRRFNNMLNKNFKHTIEDSLLESDRNSHPKTSRINQSESDRNSQS